MFVNWCVEFFYNKIYVIFLCSVIKIIIEKPSCSVSGDIIQVFKHLYQLSAKSSLYKADETKVLESLVVAEVTDFWNHHCCSSLTFSILLMGR